MRAPEFENVVAEYLMRMDSMILVQVADSTDRMDCNSDLEHCFAVCKYYSAYNAEVPEELEESSSESVLLEAAAVGWGNLL